MAENLKVTVELAALDNGSRVFNVAFDKIQGKAIATAARVSKAAFDIGKKAAVVGGLIAAPLAYGANQAIKFEDAMAGVSKVAGKGYEVGSAGLGKLSAAAKASAAGLGIAADESASLMASLASGGVAVKDLDKMVGVAGRVGVAYDMAAKDAGDAFVKMRNALGVTNEIAAKAADAINYISDNDASTAAQILAYMAQGGASVARSLNMAAPQAAVFGSALISMGKSGEEAGTIMQRFQKALYLPKNEDMLATYKAAGRGTTGLLAVLNKGASIKNPDASLQYFLRMGEYGSSISQLAKSYGKLNENMKLVADPKNYKDSVLGEFNNKNSTTGGQLRRLKAEAGVLAVDLGTSLLPVVSALAKELLPIVRQVSEWIKRNPELTSQIIKGAAAAAALSFAVSGVSTAVGGFAKAWDVATSRPMLRAYVRMSAMGARMRNLAVEAIPGLTARFPRLAGAAGSVGGMFGRIGTVAGRVFPWIMTAARGLGAAIMGISWPVGLAIAAVVALGYVIYKNWGSIKPMLINTWRTIKNVAVGTWDTIAFYVGKLWDGFTTRFTGVRTMINWIKTAIAGIKMPEWLKTFGNWASGVGSSISRGLANAANNSAAFANDAAARRGIDRQMSGAVGSNAGDIPRRVFLSNNAPAAPIGQGGRSSTVIHAPLSIVVPAGTSPTDTRHFEKLLKQHSRQIGEIVDEKNRRKKAVKLD